MTLERKIAGRARELVASEEQATVPKHERETAYRSLCEGLPILLRTAGLAQTVAFLKAKGDEHGRAYAHLETQLRESGFLGKGESLLEKAADPKLGAPEYRLLSEMAMLAAFWHKRMAQALLRKRDE